MARATAHGSPWLSSICRKKFSARRIGPANKVGQKERKTSGRKGPTAHGGSR